MQLFIAWHTSWDDADPKLAVISDDSEALRRKSQAVEAGKRIIESWLLRSGGETIDFQGPNGHCQCPANELSDLERIRTQYAQTLGDVRVAMGVGVKLSEADRALKSAIDQGGDRIVLYTPEDGKDEPDTQSLEKADPVPGPKQPAMASKTGGGGFVGATRPMAAAAPVGASGEASEHSEAEAELSRLEDAPAAAELTHSAASAEEAFEASADQADQDEKSQDEASAQGSATNELKKEVVKVLQHIKSQAPALAQLTATEPKLFATIQETIKAMLMLAKRVCGTGGASDPIAKSDTTVIVINTGTREASRGEESAGVEPEWAYHMVSEWETLDDVARFGLVPHAEEGTATLHYTTDFDSVVDREGDLLRFKCPEESSPNPYRPDRPSERITTLTIKPCDIQRRSGVEWADLRLDPVCKADAFFRHPAFLGKDGKVVATPGFHDIDQLPADFIIDREGYVSADGTFYDRATAQEMAKPAKPVVKQEPFLDPKYDDKGRLKTADKIEEEFDESPEGKSKKLLAKTEYRSGHGQDLKVVPGKDSPNRREFDKRCVREVVEKIAHPAKFDLKPRMVNVSDLAWNSSGNGIKHPGRFNMYRRMLSNNDHLPAIVIRKNGLKYDIVDGSHRVAAVLAHNGTNVSEPQKVQQMFALEMIPKLAKASPDDPGTKDWQTQMAIQNDAIQEGHPSVKVIPPRREPQPQKLDHAEYGECPLCGENAYNYEVQGHTGDIEPLGYVTACPKHATQISRDAYNYHMPDPHGWEAVGNEVEEEADAPVVRKAWPTDAESKANEEAHLVFLDHAQEHGKVHDSTPKMVATEKRILRRHRSGIPGIEPDASTLSITQQDPPRDPASPFGLPKFRVGRDHLGNFDQGAALDRKYDSRFWESLNEAVPESIAKKLPLPENAPKNVHHVYPIGAVKDHSPQGTRDVGKVKVQHDDGKTGWVEVRAGQVLSSDGHTISSRNPGGK